MAMTESFRENEGRENGDAYWDDYYRNKKAPDCFTPSQFAVFVLGELRERTRIIDVGCGSGRDAFFFAQAGHPVVGIDKSKSAIAGCMAAGERLKTASPAEIEFLAAPIEEPRLADRFAKRPDRIPLLVYCRFFLHAITGAEEDAFLDFAEAACGSGDSLALEFRTTRDAYQKKSIPGHFRRFLDPLKIIESCGKRRFYPYYFVEGFGFAKYGPEDAHVARCLLSKK